MAYLPLSTANLPDPAIDPAQGSSPEDYFNVALYAGNSSTQSITGVGHQPDFLWIKGRTVTGENHALVDVVRGTDKYLFSSYVAGTEDTNTNRVTSFDSDGFSIGNQGDVNTTGRNYVAWSWKANGSGVSNTDGSITSTVSANTTSGFSIVSYTGDGSSSATIGHGLDSAPEMVIVKSRDLASTNWLTAINVTGSYIDLNLNDTSANSNSGDGDYFPQAFTSTTFKPNVNGTNPTNGDGNTYIAYCFHSVDGFSKFGSYTGNGSADGPFIYTGFKPKWFLWKRTDGLSGWSVYDAERDPYNYRSKILYPDGADAEGTPSAYYIDFVSNGVKIRGNGSAYNGSGINVIYMAFAENPFKYSTAS